MLRLDVIRRLVEFASRVLPRVGKRLLSDLANRQSGSEERSILLQHSGLLLFLLAYGLGWWLLAKGATQLNAVACMGVVAALSFSYIIGMASMLPAGVGAREGMLVLLAPAVGISHTDMAALAVASRAAMVMMDVIAAGIGAILLQVGSNGERLA